MRVFAIALVVAVMPVAAADARPITAGVGVGRLEAQNDWDGEADGTLQAFARIGVTSRVGAQLELQKIDGNGTATVRTGTALLTVEMGQAGRLVPSIFAGFGIDRASNPYGASEAGSHIEGGLGLEYRLDGGLSLTADVRLGGRSVTQSDTVMLDASGNALSQYAPLLIQGKYNSARVGVAIRF